MTAPPTPPTFASIQEFVSRLGAVGSWWPYVAEILERHDLADAGREPVAGVGGTSPTFLYGDVVVTLCGSSRSRRESHAAERAAQALLASDRSLRAGTSSVPRWRFTPGQEVLMPAGKMPVDHVDINVSLVGQLVTTQFPQWADLPIRPVACDGWDNRTFHLGEHMTVRLPSAAAYSLQVEKEHRWLPRLAPLLPLPIPVPVAMGVPADGYPWHWSVYRWLDGEIATIERIADLRQFATSLAQFLTALQRIDPAGGPPPGPHNFFRGGPLTVYDGETRQAIAALEGKIDTDAVAGVWEAALAATWHGAPVWFHGDVSAGNLLVTSGRLSAVIDFGTSGVGDPACDLAIAWTFFAGASREAFRTELPVDNATWARGRGWALWKALIVFAELPGTNMREAEKSRRVIDAVLADHRHGA